MLDDQPVILTTRSRPLVSVPYTQECNDVAMMLIQHHPAREYRDRAIDQFVQLYEDAEHSARVMAEAMKTRVITSRRLAVLSAAA